jgi:pimeloyl-ACP methyl ester carboxylesterase
VSDLVEAHRLRLGGGVVSRLLGCEPEECPERYELASPFALLPLSVPQLLVHGERDDIVPVSMSRRYHEAALAAGETVELVTFPGGGHFEHIDPSSKEWAAVARWLDRQR